MRISVRLFSSPLDMSTKTSNIDSVSTATLHRNRLRVPPSVGYGSAPLRKPKRKSSGTSEEQRERRAR